MLALIVQNSVPYAVLGTATSGAVFFRSIGSAFGVAVYGTVFNHRLGTRLTDALAGARLPDGLNSTALGADPDRADLLPPALRSAVRQAYGSAVTDAFLYAVPVAALGFVLALLLKEKQLPAEAAE
ncbi:hypothetical protein [Streptomyces sp. NPDC051554]|uniref:hypothetical protein n=1 Tax=Streptomyces sp. NPDC051554 TaxID=3365656 RepID=UPI00378A14F5